MVFCFIVICELINAIIIVIIKRLLLWVFVVFAHSLKKSSNIVSCLKESFRFKANLCFKISVVNINGFGVNLVLCGCFFMRC